MSEHVVSISNNALVDRLRVLQSDLTAENRHGDAIVIDMAIQALKGTPNVMEKLEQSIERVVIKAVRNGNFRLAPLTR